MVNIPVPTTNLQRILKFCHSCSLSQFQGSFLLPLPLSNFSPKFGVQLPYAWFFLLLVRFPQAMSISIHIYLYKERGDIYVALLCMFSNFIKMTSYFYFQLPWNKGGQIYSLTLNN